MASSRIHADVIIYIFANLHTEGNMLDLNWLPAAEELVEINTWWTV